MQKKSNSSNAMVTILLSPAIFTYCIVLSKHIKQLLWKYKKELDLAHLHFEGYVASRFGTKQTRLECIKISQKCKHPPTVQLKTEQVALIILGIFDYD